MGAAGRLDPCDAYNATQIEVMARSPAKLLQILQLRAPVAFAKGVNIVDVAEDRPRLGGEVGKRKPAKEVLRNEAAVNVGHSGSDELAEYELTPVLRDLDDAKLSGPVVDILEEMAVDGLQMGEIKISARDPLHGAKARQLAFSGVEGGLNRQSEAVLENG